MLSPKGYELKIGDQVITCVLAYLRNNTDCSDYKCYCPDCHLCSQIHIITKIEAGLASGGFFIYTDKLESSMERASIIWFNLPQTRPRLFRKHRSHLLEP